MFGGAERKEIFITIRSYYFYLEIIREIIVNFGTDFESEIINSKLVIVKKSRELPFENLIIKIQNQNAQ